VVFINTLVNGPNVHEACGNHAGIILSVIDMKKNHELCWLFEVTIEQENRDTLRVVSSFNRAVTEALLLVT